jgi:hypothetical protein
MFGSFAGRISIMLQDRHETNVAASVGAADRAALQNYALAREPHPQQIAGCERSLSAVKIPAAPGA